VSLWRYINVTRNPSLESVRRFMLEGERATWPRLEMIRNQTMISQTLDRCVDKLENHKRRHDRAAVAAEARVESRSTSATDAGSRRRITFWRGR